MEISGDRGASESSHLLLFAEISFGQLSRSPVLWLRGFYALSFYFSLSPAFQPVMDSAAQTKFDLVRPRATSSYRKY